VVSQLRDLAVQSPRQSIGHFVKPSSRLTRQPWKHQVLGHTFYKQRAPLDGTRVLGLRTRLLERESHDGDLLAASNANQIELAFCHHIFPAKPAIRDTVALRGFLESAGRAGWSVLAWCDRRYTFTTFAHASNTTRCGLRNIQTTGSQPRGVRERRHHSDSCRNGPKR